MSVQDVSITLLPHHDVSMFSHYNSFPPKAQAVLDRYRAVLHEYREHKAEVSPWLDAFAAQNNGRQPSLMDAERTGDIALVSR